ncbi:DUF433 domain-containing protein [Saliphagus sp. LR7]|uniref:DUF433 domain-containing protein n=1 Tax=Saliphagus sp. LR7 TaxID=2282654 RepID=UPI000DF820F3|nr:DUF433 domain-containing protein [Saliphagus sp. LR7]
MAQQAARIVRDDDVMDGEPRVDGRRITVLRIQELVETRGLPAAEVAAMHDLDVADVYAALTYYYEHSDEIASIQEHRENREQTARDAGAPTIGDLVADREGTEPDETESA